jgi:hypothetical protein
MRELRYLKIWKNNINTKFILDLIESTTQSNYIVKENYKKKYCKK